MTRQPQSPLRAISVAGTGLLLMAALSAAPAFAAQAGAHDKTASCIAVMQSRADDLARQVKTGDTGQTPALRSELERAAALVGRAYLDGARDEAQSKAKLQEAQDAQATWSVARKSALHQTCVRMVDADLAAANSSQRFIVRSIAQSRLQRMLAAP